MLLELAALVGLCDGGDCGGGALDADLVCCCPQMGHLSTYSGTAVASTRIPPSDLEPGAYQHRKSKAILSNLCLHCRRPLGFVLPIYIPCTQIILVQQAHGLQVVLLLNFRMIFNTV